MLASRFTQKNHHRHNRHSYSEVYNNSWHNKEDNSYKIGEVVIKKAVSNVGYLSPCVRDLNDDSRLWDTITCFGLSNSTCEGKRLTVLLDNSKVSRHYKSNPIEKDFFWGIILPINVIRYKSKFW